MPQGGGGIGGPNIKGRKIKKGEDKSTREEVI